MITTSNFHKHEKKKSIIFDNPKLDCVIMKTWSKKQNLI